MELLASTRDAPKYHRQQSDLPKRRPHKIQVVDCSANTACSKDRIRRLTTHLSSLSTADCCTRSHRTVGHLHHHLALRPRWYPPLHCCISTRLHPYDE